MDLKGYLSQHLTGIAPQSVAGAGRAAFSPMTQPPPTPSKPSNYGQAPAVPKRHDGGGTLEQMPRFLTVDQLRQRMGGGFGQGMPMDRAHVMPDGAHMGGRADQMRALVDDMIAKIRAGQPIGGIDELRKQFFG